MTTDEVDHVEMSPVDTFGLPKQIGDGNWMVAMQEAALLALTLIEADEWPDVQRSAWGGQWSAFTEDQKRAVAYGQSVLLAQASQYDRHRTLSESDAIARLRSFLMDSTMDHRFFPEDAGKSATLEQACPEPADEAVQMAG